jgi:hypothetical protein
MRPSAFAAAPRKPSGGKQQVDRLHTRVPVTVRRTSGVPFADRLGEFWNGLGVFCPSGESYRLPDSIVELLMISGTKTHRLP